MRAMVLVSVFLALVAILLPLSASSEPLLPADAAEPAPEVTGPPASPRAVSFDKTCSVALLDGDRVRYIPLSDYLFGAVAAEMPATFEPAALEAQAVALRSYLLHKMLAGPVPAHPQAHICSDSACCAAWRPEDYLREKWGGSFDEYAGRIRAAVAATDGMTLAYEGSPALAVFHAASLGRTESAEEVWSSALPYLVSVESPESAETLPELVSAVTVSAREFQQTVLSRYPAASFGPEISKWIGDIVTSDGGRIHTVELGGVAVPGTVLRSLFGLKSTAVTFSVEGSAITMTASGYGHGVGMSQYGANELAKSGASAEDILLNYYPGTALVNAAAFFTGET